LKPCPFCGRDNIEIYPTGYGHPPRYVALCNSCQAGGPEDLGESGAIEQWNTRPREAELEAWNADLERVLRMYPEWTEDGKCLICYEYGGKHSPSCPRQKALGEP